MAMAGADVVVVDKDEPGEFLVNTVGVTPRQRFLDISPPELDEVLRTNLRAHGCSPSGWWRP
jgi:hypothetical protein